MTVVAVAGTRSERRMPGLARLDGPARVQGVDLARGLAVLGMVAAHLLVIRDFDLTDPRTWTDVVDGRSSILFATLAGVSIGLVTGGRAPLRSRARQTAAFRLVVRAVLLWFVGVLLIGTGVPIYVILPAYGILFLLALPFLALRASVLLPCAAVVAVVGPFLFQAMVAAAGGALDRDTQLSDLLGWRYPVVVWLAFVLAGLGLARADLRRTATLGLAVLAGAALAVFGYAGGAVSDALRAGPVLSSIPHSSGVFEVIGSGGVALAVIGVCCLACRSALLSRIVLPLRAVGSMPLTAYTAQILAWWAVASIAVGDVSDLRAFQRLQPFWWFALGAVVLCTAWALLVGRGPLEWVVDRVTRAVVPDPAPLHTPADLPSAPTERTQP